METDKGTKTGGKKDYRNKISANNVQVAPRAKELQRAAIHEGVELQGKGKWRNR